MVSRLGLFCALLRVLCRLLSRWLDLTRYRPSGTASMSSQYRGLGDHAFG